jgi:hypothetical protein
MTVDPLEVEAVEVILERPPSDVEVTRTSGFQDAPATSWMGEEDPRSEK